MGAPARRIGAGRRDGWADRPPRAAERLRSTRRRTSAVLLGRRYRRLLGYAGRPYPKPATAPRCWLDDDLWRRLRVPHQLSPPSKQIVDLLDTVLDPGVSRDAR